MGGKRSTKTETQDRIFTVQGWIINRKSDLLILKQCVELWGVTERQAKNYLSKAYTIWADATEATIDQKRRIQIAKLQREQNNMKEEFRGTPAGMRVILAIEKEINRLEGLIGPHRHIHSGDPEHPIEINNSEERERRIAELVKKAGLTANK